MFKTTAELKKPTEACKRHDQDFSEEWEQSDLILLVEEQYLHVHRAILAMSSPVFSRMFAGDHKEKNAKLLPLPGKNCNEIKEMLLAIYPTSWKPVDERNYNFLLSLAQEYQMMKLTEKCEDYLMVAVAKNQGSDVMETLVLAQDYALKRLLVECIDRTQMLSNNDVKRHPLYDQIEPLSQRRMIELQMQKGEKEIERMQQLANGALQQLKKVVVSLASHIDVADNESRLRHSFEIRIDDYLRTIKNDRPTANASERRQGICKSLAEVGGPLEVIQSSLLKISRSKILESTAPVAQLVEHGLVTRRS
ncbi:uncharacterized protein [Montipora capricornis]|uniref:uncharacterized protein n=1 Tax=Montipora capricornis TaxID=246305 RepID=UPI0035F1651A